MLEKTKFWIKKKIWRHRNSHNLTGMGCNFRINRVSVGKNTYGPVTVLDASPVDYFLKIGSYCSISQGVKFLLAVEHNLNTISTYPFKSLRFGYGAESHGKGDIIVEDDVWIGENAIIGSGVKIGQGAVVAAGAIVVKDVEPYTVVGGGGPAKFIRYRFPEEIRKELLKIDVVKLFDLINEGNIDLFYSELTKEKLKEIVGLYGDVIYKNSVLI